MKDDGDVQRQIRCMYSKINTLLRKFGKCCSAVKAQSFNWEIYIVLSQLWANVKVKYIQKLRVVYDNYFCAFLDFLVMSSTSNIFVLNGVLSYAEFSLSKIYNFGIKLTVMI